MKYNFVIKNGHVIDPARGIDAVEDVWIRHSKIVPAPSETDYEVEEIVDAQGCYVFPGLINFHTHLGYRSTDIGLNTDLFTLPNGITSAVDQGSAGPGNMESMIHETIAQSSITMKCFMNVASTGMVTEQYFEDLHPEFFDIDRMDYLFERYSNEILGFKVRIGKSFSKDLDLIPLEAAIKLGNRFQLPIVAHVTNPESSYDKIMPHFRSGDILCHCFQKQGEYSILDDNGILLDSVKEARERKVLFDGAAGRRNYSLDIIQRALSQGFEPDIISDDVIAQTIYRKIVFALPYTMSVYLAAGMPLEHIIRAVTATPAHLMHMDGEIGTLAPGALADVAIMSVIDKKMVLKDLVGNEMNAEKLFVPIMTVKAGRIAYRRIDFTY